MSEACRQHTWLARTSAFLRLHSFAGTPSYMTPSSTMKIHGLHLRLLVRVRGIHLARLSRRHISFLNQSFRRFLYCAGQGGSNAFSNAFSLSRSRQNKRVSELEDNHCACILAKWGVHLATAPSSGIHGRILQATCWYTRNTSIYYRIRNSAQIHT